MKPGWVVIESVWIGLDWCFAVIGFSSWSHGVMKKMVLFFFLFPVWEGHGKNSGYTMAKHLGSQRGRNGCKSLISFPKSHPALCYYSTFTALYSESLGVSMVPWSVFHPPSGLYTTVTTSPTAEGSMTPDKSVSQSILGSFMNTLLLSLLLLCDPMGFGKTLGL